MHSFSSVLITSLWVSLGNCLSNIELQCIPSVTYLAEKLFSGYFNSESQGHYKVLFAFNLPS
jgi:hypothetical protein